LLLLVVVRDCVFLLVVVAVICGKTHTDWIVNPKEECKVVMTRSKRLMEAEDEDSVVSKKKAVEKKGIDDKKDDVRGESNQQKEKQIMVKKKELNDQEKEKENEKN